MSDDSLALTPTRALHNLEERRRFLQRLVGATRMIEVLKHSMEHMLNQGAPDADKHPQMAQFLAELDRKVRVLPDAEVALRLETLDQRLCGLFERLTPFIDQINAADTPIEELSLNAAEEDIYTLKRIARTALALRGLLRQRGQGVSDLLLPLDRDRLQDQLQAIRAEEQKARRLVIQQVARIGGEVRQLLDRAELTGSMRSLLEQMLMGLRANLAHLKEGKSVLELPLKIENSCFLEPAPETASPSTGERGSTLALPDAKAAPQARTEPKPQSVEPREAGTDLPYLPRPGLARTIRLWISSPWEVKWRDIREGRYPG